MPDRLTCPCNDAHNIESDKINHRQLSEQFATNILVLTKLFKVNFHVCFSYKILHNTVSNIYCNHVIAVVPNFLSQPMCY